jgi:hypothetical protein
MHMHTEKFHCIHRDFAILGVLLSDKNNYIYIYIYILTFELQKCECGSPLSNNILIRRIFYVDSVLYVNSVNT